MNMEHHIIKPTNMPVRTLMWQDADDYDGIDEGVRFAVKVLHAAGIATCQSCQGGEGHSYKEPTIEMIATGNDADGFAALAALRSYGLPVSEVSCLWNIDASNGLPYEKLWRITFSRTMEERAGDSPSFERLYRYYEAPARVNVLQPTTKLPSLKAKSRTRGR